MGAGPYGTAAASYWRAGWRGILPLPAKAKKNPPAGYTGAAGVDPSYPDVDAWATGPESDGNIALRVPPHVIGLDVDAYGDKPGEATLKLAEAAHGPLPATWRTTSRDDGISGIRFYRVPEGLAWPGEIGPATELIQTRHRYAIVWPSIHPEGKTYRWIDPDGVVSTTIPDPDDFPALPQPWIDAFTGGELSALTPRVKVRHAEAIAWLVARPHATEAMCARMERTTDTMQTDLAGSAHAAARDATLRIARLADEGHHGAVFALTWARNAFITDATNPNRPILGKARRTRDEAVYEWGELVASAVGVVLADRSGVKTCDCLGQITGLITGTPLSSATSGSSALAPLMAPRVAGSDTAPDAEPDALARMSDGATFILDAPETVPSVWGDGDDCLWSRGEALMLVGPPGVGKTTLVGQLVRGLLGLQETVLGLPVAATGQRILYLAMDRPAQIARGLRRLFADSDRAILADRLRVWSGPPPGDMARHPDVMLALATLAEADVVVVDSMKDAAVGLTEDEGAAAYNRARQLCLANGVEVCELHHMVKRGANGNKPTDLADVYGSAWLTAGAGSVVLLWGAAGDPVVDFRHLKQPAGEVGPWRLIHDHVTGTTSIYHAADLLQTIAAAGAAGVTVGQAATLIFDKEKPTASEVHKARRKLERLVAQGHVERHDAPRDVWGGGKPQAVYVAAKSNSAAIPREVGPDPNPETFANDGGDKTPGQPIDTPIPPIPGKVQFRFPPPLRGGTVDPSTANLDFADCNRCGRTVPVSTLKVLRGYCPACSTSAKDRS